MTKEIRRIKVLIVCDYYLPGFRGGGLVRSIKNICNELNGVLDIWIYTRNFDSGTTVPYDDIIYNKWLKHEGFNAFYADKRHFSFSSIFNEIKKNSFDVLYLNSLFSYRASIEICLFRRLANSSKIPILLAPRGELDSGALAIKKIRKSLYLYFSKIFGLYNSIYFQASTNIEAVAIISKLGVKSDRVHVATDIISTTNSSVRKNLAKYPNVLDVVFISRIAEKKNLHFLIKLLGLVNHTVNLDIYGPIEDFAYWKKCQSFIKKSSLNIVYKGFVEPDEVANVFSNYHLFVFPTLGENFGHVIFESLSVGTPVIASNCTPWLDDEFSAITTIELNDTQQWIKEINKFIEMTDHNYNLLRQAALDYVSDCHLIKSSVESNVKLFNYVVSQK